MFWSVSTYFKKGSPEKNKESSVVETLPKSYTLYTKDPELKTTGSPRTYFLDEGSNMNWVSLSAQELTGRFTIINGHLSNAKMGFVPTADLRGVMKGRWWVVDSPQKGDLQRGILHINLNSYGGFDLKFFYEDGSAPATGMLIPMSK